MNGTYSKTEDLGQINDAQRTWYLRTHPDLPAPTRATIEKEGVVVGMTAEQCRASWGLPEHVNHLTTAGGVQEQWVYDRYNYLYLDNGILTASRN